MLKHESPLYLNRLRNILYLKKFAVKLNHITENQSPVLTAYSIVGVFELRETGRQVQSQEGTHKQLFYILHKPFTFGFEIFPPNTVCTVRTVNNEEYIHHGYHAHVVGLIIVVVVVVVVVVVLLLLQCQSNECC